ncbi:MAG TPA: hypothetical protein VFL55_08460 [Acetobacteraceae bacterium]|nr:hypothetical protein [Acetobacteraceae bacterium]
MAERSEPAIYIALVLAAFAALSSTPHAQSNPTTEITLLLRAGSDGERIATAGAIGEDLAAAPAR